MIALEGRARVLGANVNTDYIISSTRKRETIDEQVLKQWLLETLDSAFAASVREGDIIVAGENFGCGSAMEVAVTVILAAGIRAVVAPSFSRTFYRNAINNGLIPVRCDTSGFEEGDRIGVGLDDSGLLVTNHTRNQTFADPKISGIMRDILEQGGLVPYMIAHHGLGPEGT